MNFMGWIIVGCEIAFWIVIILGLAIDFIICCSYFIWPRKEKSVN
ncbi:hypothetical protein [Peribacillus asahii]|nr:hypothetical protein [Peribacillus asahii]